MNEQIEELAMKAGIRFEFLHVVHYDDFDYREFAKLIIKECCVTADANIDDSKYPSYWIKKKFGVKE